MDSCYSLRFENFSFLGFEHEFQRGRDTAFLLKEEDTTLIQQNEFIFVKDSVMYSLCVCVILKFTMCSSYSNM